MMDVHFPLSALVLSLVLTSASGIKVLADDRPAAGTAAEVAPRGQRDLKDVTYGSWRKLCFKPGGAPMVCRTSMTGTLPTGQVAVRLDLIERVGDRTGRLQVFVPVGMYLQHPVKLKIDQGRSYELPYTWCLSNTCIAAAPADPRIVRDMEAGKVLLLEVVDTNLLALSTSLPLTQFVATHRSAPAQTFEQDIDE